MIESMAQRGKERKERGKERKRNRETSRNSMTLTASGLADLPSGQPLRYIRNFSRMTPPRPDCTAEIDVRGGPTRYKLLSAPSFTTAPNVCRISDQVDIPLPAQVDMSE